MTNKSIHPLSNAIDEALWAAYRRDDKAAVMDYLFHRNLVGIARSRSFPQPVIKSATKRGAATRRTYGGPMLINRSARQIPLPSALN